MHLVDILLLIAIAGLLILALIGCFRKKKGGCCGDCAQCRRHHASGKPPED